MSAIQQVNTNANFPKDMALEFLKNQVVLKDLFESEEFQEMIHSLTYGELSEESPILDGDRVTSLLSIDRTVTGIVPGIKEVDSEFSVKIANSKTNKEFACNMFGYLQRTVSAIYFFMLSKEFKSLSEIDKKVVTATNELLLAYGSSCEKVFAKESAKHLH